MRRAFALVLATVSLGTSSAGAGPPGNGRIALVDRDQFGGSDVYTVEPDGSGRARLTFDRRSLAPVFSPDGSRLAFLKSHPPALDLYVMNADVEGGPRLLASHPEGQGGGNGIFSVVWSPDGTRIAYLLLAGQRRRCTSSTRATGARCPSSATRSGSPRSPGRPTERCSRTPRRRARSHSERRST